MIGYEGFGPYGDERSQEALFEAIVQERKSGVAAHYDIMESSLELIPSLQNIEEAKEIVVIGIGGSSLGTKAIYALFRHRLSKKMIFLENPDPIEIEEKIEKIDPNDAIFFVVSKSGRTVETLSIFRIVANRFDLLRKPRRLFFITAQGSPLESFAKRRGFGVFHIPHNLSGRFSVLGAVGIAPLYMAGVDVVGLLEGAIAFRDRFFAHKEPKLLQKALFLVDFPIYVLFAYGTRFGDFAKWFEQLIAESLGKRNEEGKAVGITPCSHIGSVDQHSFLQLLMDGPKDKAVSFLRVRSCEKELVIAPLDDLEEASFVVGHGLCEMLHAECLATYRALKSVDVAVELMELEGLEAKDVGELIFHFELLTSLMGILLGVDTYNQPGVELGKRILRSMFDKERE